MYALAPSASARERSSCEPSVVMMMMGMSLCASSVRMRFTSLSPSMMGMLMSVTMMSNLRTGELAQAVHAVVGLGDLELAHALQREHEELPHHRRVFDDETSILSHVSLTSGSRRDRRER